MAVGAARRKWHQARWRDGAILQVSGCTGQDRARRQGSSPVELEPGDRAGDLAPITLLDSGCRVLIGVRCPSGDRTRSTKPRKVAKLSARAGILRVKCLISGTGPGRPSRGPEAYDPRTAENITNRDTMRSGVPVGEMGAAEGSNCGGSIDGIRRDGAMAEMARWPRRRDPAGFRLYRTGSSAQAGFEHGRARIGRSGRAIWPRLRSSTAVAGSLLAPDVFERSDPAARSLTKWQSCPPQPESCEISA